MKKMLVAFAAIASAIVAQAASITWGTSEITELAGYDFGSEAITMIVYENNAAYDISTIWSDYQAGTLAGTNVGEATDDIMASIFGMSVDGGSSWTEGDTVYGAIIFTHTDELGKVDYYMVNTASGTAADAGADVSDLGTTIGGIDGVEPTVWTSTEAVPEPTSGLLLLIGMAGLALRRRRA